VRTNNDLNRIPVALARPPTMAMPSFALRSTRRSLAGCHAPVFPSLAGREVYQPKPGPDMASSRSTKCSRLKRMQPFGSAGPPFVCAHTRVFCANRPQAARTADANAA
jgi:hypothetical protein